MTEILICEFVRNITKKNNTIMQHNYFTKMTEVLICEFV